MKSFIANSQSFLNLYTFVVNTMYSNVCQLWSCYLSFNCGKVLLTNFTCKMSSNLKCIHTFIGHTTYISTYFQRKSFLSLLFVTSAVNNSQVYTHSSMTFHYYVPVINGRRHNLHLRLDVRTHTRTFSFTCVIFHFPPLTNMLSCTYATTIATGTWHFQLEHFRPFTLSNTNISQCLTFPFPTFLNVFANSKKKTQY